MNTGPGSGQSSWIGERLVGEEQPLVRTHLECLEAEAARAVSGRPLRMDRVTVLRRLHRLPRRGRHSMRDALNSVGHSSVLKWVAARVIAQASVRTPILAFEFARRADWTPFVVSEHEGEVPCHSTSARTQQSRCWSS
jgi:hypothetical protein